MRRVVLLLGVLAVLCGTAVAGAGPAAAAGAQPMGQCTTSSGVVLAVDFGYWGGPVLRACGATPTTGFQLLNEGGWATTGTRHDGPDFICKISYSGYRGGTAMPSNQTCANTPPSSAMWSYWHAGARDSGWTYSQDGAANYQPKPGSVELWTFGGGSRPGFGPDAVRAHNSAPAGAASPSAAPRTSAAAPSGAPAPGSAASSTGAVAAPGGGNPARSSAGADSGMGHTALRVTASKPKPAGTASPAGSTATVRATSSGSLAVAIAPPAASSRHRTGSLLPALLTAILVLGLGGAAGLMAWRRRQLG